MSTEDVLINFVGRVDELKPSVDVLDHIIQQEGEIGEAWKKTATTISNTTKQSTGETNKLAKSIEQMAVAAKSMDKVVVAGAYKQYLKEIQTQLGLTNKEVVAYIKNARTAAQTKIVTDATEAEVKELTLAIEVMNDQLQALGAQEDDTTQKTASLRTRLREAKEELFAMAEAGLQGTPAFEELKQVAGELDDKMKDLNQTVAGIGSDTRKIDGLISLASGVAGGFAVAQGAAALFGSENEEVQKALLKVNAAMAILQGLQQIQITLQKESAASLLFQRSATVAQTGATVAQATATGAATVAQTGLNTAMKANPIGLIITGILAVVAALNIFDSSIETSEERMKRMSEEAEKLYEALQKLSKVNQFAIDREIAIVKNQELVNILVAQGASVAKINAAKKEGLKLERQSLDNQLRDIESSKELAADKNQFVERELAIKTKIYQNDKAQLVLDIETNREAAKAAKEIGKRNSDAEFEMARRELERQIEANEKLADNEQLSLQFRLDTLDTYWQARLDLLEVQRDHELAKEKLTAKEIENIWDEYTKNVLDGFDAFGTKKLQILTQFHEREKAQAERFRAEFEAIEKQSVENANAGVKAHFDGIAFNLSNQTNERLAAAEGQYKKGLIDLKAYEKKRQDIIKESAQAELATEILKINALIEIKKANGEDVTDLLKKLNEAQEALRKFDLEGYKETEADKTKATADEIAKRLMYAQAANQIIQAVFDAGFEASAQRRQDALQEQLALLGQQRDQEIANENITKQQKADIEEKYRQKEKQEKIKGFQADKEAKRQQAIMNSALAVGNALATVQPFLPNAIIAAGIAAAMGIIQVTKINATQPPRFREGEVDIQGPGTTTSDSIHAMISNRESVINAKQTAKWKDALLAINNDKFEHYLLKHVHQFAFPEVPGFVQSNSGTSGPIDYELLSSAIASKIPEPTYIQMKMDSEGLHSFVKKGSSITEFKNHRYSMK